MLAVLIRHGMENVYSNMCLYSEQETVGQKPVPSAGVTRGGMLHRPSAAMCVGILPGLGAYSGSSDSESSSDSEGSVEGTTSSIKCHRLFR